MELKLNIYDENENIVKTHTRQSFSIKMKLLKKIIKTIDLENLAGCLGTDGAESNIEMVKIAGNLVVNAYDTVKELMKQVFMGLTDEEYENTTIEEVAIVLIGLVKNTMNTIAIAGGKGKN